MSDLVAILGVGLWMPGYPSADAWARRERDEELPKPKGNGLDPVNRRRAKLVGRSIADSATEAMQQARVDPAEVATVVGSAMGEASTMIGLLDQMWRTKEPMSPAAFTVSVHNAASGLLSIASKNSGYTTSLAADADTPAVALLEGIGLVLGGGGPALVACADEGAPLSLVRDSESWGPLAAAVVLGPADAEGALARLAIRTGGDALPLAEVEPSVVSNPEVGMLGLVDAVQRGVKGRVRLDRGKGRGYLAELS